MQELLNSVFIRLEESTLKDKDKGFDFKILELETVKNIIKEEIEKYDIRK